jgi:hypothetical protein
VRIGPPAVGIELAGAIFLPQDQMVPGAPGAAARWTFAYAGASLCPRVISAASLTVLGCAGVSAGTVTAVPRGLETAQQSTNAVVLANVGARLEWRFRLPFLASAGAGAAIPFSRESYTYVDAGGTTQTLFRAQAAALVADLSLGVSFD